MGFGAFALVAPGRSDVTAESQFASQALQGEHSWWGSDCRAGNLELDVRCRWRSVWQLWWVLAGSSAQAVGTGNWRYGCRDGHGSMEARLGRVIGRPADGESHSALPCQTRQLLFCLSVCSVRLPICLCYPGSQPDFSQPVSQLFSQCLIGLRLRLRLRPRGSPVDLELPSHSRRAPPPPPQR